MANWLIERTVDLQDVYKRQPTVLEGLTNAREWITPKAQALMTSLGTALASTKDYAVEHLPAVRDALISGLGIAKDKMTGVAKNAMTCLLYTSRCV